MRIQIIANLTLSCVQFPGDVDAGSETARRGTPAAGKSHELCQAQDQSAACYVRHTHVHIDVRVKM